MTTATQNRRSGPASRARLQKTVYFLPLRYISSDMVVGAAVPVYDAAKISSKWNALSAPWLNKANGLLLVCCSGFRVAVSGRRGRLNH